MSHREPLDAAIATPGFHGHVVGQFAGMTVVKGVIDGALPAHEAAGDELAVVLYGRMEVDLAGKRLQLEAGDHLIVPAGTAHAVRSIGTACVLLIAAA